MRTLKLLLFVLVLSMPFYSCEQESVEPNFALEIADEELDSPRNQGSGDDGDR